MTKEQQQLEELAKALTYHQDQAAQHKAAAAAAEAKIRQALGGPTRDVPVGSLVIDWAPPKRSFDAEAFLKAYPPAKNPHMYREETVTQLDMAMVPPKLKENFMAPGKGEGTLKIK